MKNLQRYYKLKEEELEEYFKESETNLRQEINELTSRNEVISNQLTRYRSAKDPWGEERRDAKLHKQKTATLNRLDEANDELDKLRKEHEIFLNNKKKRIEKELEKDVRRYKECLTFVNQWEKEIIKKANEIKTFENDVVSRSANEKGLLSKFNLWFDRRKLENAKNRIDEDYNTCLKYKELIKQLLEDPSKIFDNENRNFIDSFYEKHSDRNAEFEDAKRIDTKSNGKPSYFLAYLFGIITGLIVYFLSGKDRREKFHGTQATLLGIIVIIIAILGIGILGAFLNFFIWLYGLYIGYQGYKGKDVLIPVIGKFARNHTKI